MSASFKTSPDIFWQLLLPTLRVGHASDPSISYSVSHVKCSHFHSIFCKPKLFSLDYYLRKLGEQSNIGIVTLDPSSQ